MDASVPATIQATTATIMARTQRSECYQPSCNRSPDRREAPALITCFLVGVRDAECVFEHRRSHEPRPAVSALEEQAMLVIAVDRAGLGHDVSAWCLVRSSLPGCCDRRGHCNARPSA